MKRGPRLALSVPTTCGPFQGGRFVTYLHRTPRSAKHSLVTLSRNRFDEITLNKSASNRQPHWHRHLDVKRPNRPTGFLAADFRGLVTRNAQPVLLKNSTRSRPQGRNADYTPK